MQCIEMQRLQFERLFVARLRLRQPALLMQSEALREPLLRQGAPGVRRLERTLSCSLCIHNTNTSVKFPTNLNRGSSAGAALRKNATTRLYVGSDPKNL